MAWFAFLKCKCYFLALVGVCYLQQNFLSLQVRKERILALSWKEKSSLILLGMNGRNIIVKGTYKEV